MVERAVADRQGTSTQNSAAAPGVSGMVIAEGAAVDDEKTAAADAYGPAVGVGEALCDSQMHQRQRSTGLDLE